MTTRTYFTLGAALALASAACSSSSVSDVTDSGSSKDVEVRSDAGKSDTGTKHDTGTPIADAGAPDVTVTPQPVFSADAGITWTALYRDYFGNDTATHTAGCSNGSFCHNSTTDQGYQASNFICPKGNATACYESFTAQDGGAAQLVTPDAGWTNDDLSSILCLVDDAGTYVSGTMPYSCPYNFTPTDVARITAWIAAGYPND